MNNITLLHPEVLKNYHSLEEICKEYDINIRIIDGVRLHQEQDRIYSKGRISSGDISTIGKYPDNYHCWGLAIDIETDNLKDYSFIGELSKELGFRWGEDRSEIKNIHHLELPLFSLRELKYRYRNIHEFISSYDKNYKPINIVSPEYIEKVKMNREGLMKLQRAYNSDLQTTDIMQRIMDNGDYDEKWINRLGNQDYETNHPVYLVLKEIQIIMKNNGYDVDIDGRISDKFKSELYKFQLNNDLIANKIISPEFIIILLSK